MKTALDISFRILILVVLSVYGLISILFPTKIGNNMTLIPQPKVHQSSQEPREPSTYQLPDANQFDSVKTCTPEQFSAIERDLFKTKKNIKFSTACPENSWLSKYYIEYFARNRPDEKTTSDTPEPTNTSSRAFLGISVGCNKGFDAIESARMYMSNTKFNKTTWREAFEIDMGAGFCRQEQVDNATVFDIQHNPMKEDEMHCIEPLPPTFDILLNASQKLGLDKEGFVLSKAAISSSNGIARFPKVLLAGWEGFSISSCNEEPERCEEDFEEVPMYSLQTYVNNFVRSTGPINILSIDVEGFDFDVLFGAGDVLDRTQYLEFEFHDVGNWKKYRVMDAVNLLDGKGFTCYWLGIERLWRLTECNHPYYDNFHDWSNVACVHRSQEELARIMENIFLDTVN